LHDYINVEHLIITVPLSDFFSDTSDKATEDGFSTASRKQSGNSGMDVSGAISNITEKHRTPLIGVRSFSSLPANSERVKTKAHFV
jgi:hypothetical protein